MLTPVGMSRLETASGHPFGTENGSLEVPGGELTSPAAALQEAVLPALRRPPCVISFSGGRDSSVVLWAAVAAARREGLPAPIPCTLRFPGAPATDESRWQELVVAHLGVRDWVRVELHQELGFIGPVACTLLQSHGPLYPPNVHLIVPALEHAAGGSILIGVGGDQVFGFWRRRRLADVAARRCPPSWRDLVRIAGAVIPRKVRRAALRLRGREDWMTSWELPWLRDEAQAELHEAKLDARASAPVRWGQHVHLGARSRDVTLAVRDLRRVAAGADVELHAPLVAPRFLASLARAGGWRGFGGRGAVMRALFGDCLPADLLSREDKAVFVEPFFTDEVRAFAERWSGRGLDESAVDPEALRRIWLDPVSDYRSAVLLQSAWLHDHAAGRC